MLGVNKLRNRKAIASWSKKKGKPYKFLTQNVFSWTFVLGLLLAAQMFNQTHLSCKITSQRSMTSSHRRKISYFCLCNTLGLLTVNNKAWQLLIQWENGRHPSVYHRAAVQKYAEMLCLNHPSVLPCWGEWFPCHLNLEGQFPKNLA